MYLRIDVIGMNLLQMDIVIQDKNYQTLVLTLK